MQYIFDFIDFLVNMISSVWSFFIAVLVNMKLMIQYCGIALEICARAVLSMPAWMRAFGTLTVSISLLYVLVGRNTGGLKQ